MDRRVRESIKTLAIVLLTISGVVLGGMTGLFSEMFAPGAADARSGGGEKTISAAARPLKSVITNETGLRYGVEYDGAAMSTVYSSLGTLLGEALGSSGEMTEISEEEWRLALGGKNVYFDYVNEFPLELIAAWLGTEVSGDAASREVSRLMLAAGEGEQVVLYCMDNAGACFMASTASLYTSLAEEAYGYTISGVSFAFELGDGYSGGGAYTLISPAGFEMNRIIASSPLSSSGAESILSAFGMNPLTTANYVESDGTLVYVESDGTLRVGPDETVIYRRTANPGALAIDTQAGLAQAAEYCRALTARTLGALAGGASIYLSSVEVHDDGDISLRFDYYWNGVRVILPGDEAAAEYEIAGGSVRYAVLRPRRYEAGTGFTSVLPRRQAAVLAGGIDENGLLTLCYRDYAAGEIEAEWIVR